MSQVSRGVFAAIAISLTLGVAQFASGRDLPEGPQGIGETPVTPVNRAAKADRVGAAVMGGRQTRTILLQPSSLSETSVLVRIPVAQATRNAPATTPLWIRSGDRKAVACEPAVSVLTEVAKRLQPGRCIT